MEFMEMNEILGKHKSVDRIWFDIDHLKSKLASHGRS